ncbi:hypothetical protein VD0002_g183 [Verticillium dahliae]|nr:Putative translation initiation factor eIF-2B subunit beta [Verticillium dahliae VDG2]PNH70522.1 hypothetical protein VD0002_g183 [Verticillium dahliae]
MYAAEGTTLRNCSSKQRARYLSRLAEVIKCFKKMSEIVVDPASNGRFHDAYLLAEMSSMRSLLSLQLR